MIIRFSNPDDIQNIVSLWRESFGDNENDIRFFLDRNYKSDNTLVVEYNGKIVSMLFLLEGKLRINDFDYPSYYLYAACTDVSFRGKGLMFKLLSEAAVVARKRKKDFICLKPAEESLYTFYERNGYVTAFNKKILTLQKNELTLSSKAEKSDDIQFDTLRNNAFSNYDYFKWDDKAINFAVKQTKYYHGNLIKTRKGFCLYNIIEGEIHVKEYAFTEENFDYGLAQLAAMNDFQKIVIELPSQYKTKSENGQIIKSGMLYTVSDRSRIIAENVKNAYLSLTLD